MDLKLQARIDAAKQKLAEVKARLTEEDQAEIAALKELADIKAECEQEELKQRNLDLDRRVLAAQEALGPDAKIEGLAVQEFSDTFIVKRNGRAHAQWTRAMTNAAATGKKDVDREAINRKYAIQVIYDWNGHTDFDGNTERTKALNDFLVENPGIVSPITDVAGKLAGVFAEERKSGA